MKGIWYPPPSFESSSGRKSNNTVRASAVGMLKWSTIQEKHTDVWSDCLRFSVDGYVVCEENAEILRAAWEEEQVIQQKKEREVRTCFFVY